MTSATPSAQRRASGIMVSQASSVSTSPSVARMAASASALAVRVPPTPLTSASGLSVTGARRASATSRVKP